MILRKVRYVDPKTGDMRDGFLWNHRTGFFPENEADVMDCESGAIIHVYQFRITEGV